MTTALINHLWQSTLFAIAAGLLTLAFRKNRAQVRYWLWFSASVKFLVPFALLMSLGGIIERAQPVHKIAPRSVSTAMVEISEPFPQTMPLTATAARSSNWIPSVLLAAWAFGSAAIAFMRGRDWFRIRAALRFGSPIDIPAPVEVRSSTARLEPGVFGLFHQILLLPADILTHLTPDEMKTVLAHEFCHIRRRDNLTSAIHMVVEAVFWFHPFVWWIGARLVEERELACDEDVLQAGGEPHIYAEAILSVCKSYVESRVLCVSGVSGADLKKRIHQILSGRIVAELGVAKKVALVACAIVAVALPAFVGRLRAQQTATPKFEVAAIKTCPGNAPQGRGNMKGGGGRGNTSPERLQLNCQTVSILMQQAYGDFADGQTHRMAKRLDIEGGPPWMRSERFSINAKAETPQKRTMMQGPMLQALLEDRFKLKFHRETRQVPVYELTMVKSGSKSLQPAKADCFTVDFNNLTPPPPPPKPGETPRLICGAVWRSPNGLGIQRTTMGNLADQFSLLLNRNVIDKTGIAGTFDINVEFAPEDVDMPPIDPEAGRAAEQQARDEAWIFAAVRKLGLKLQSAKGPGEFIVIDHVERPSEN